jgi:hypothetical protein
MACTSVHNISKKITHKLGVERNIHTIKHVKTQIQTEKELTEHQL